jgi:hypothetical protein
MLRLVGAGAEYLVKRRHSVLFSYLLAERLPALDRAVFPAYLQGLRDAGWQGDEAQVRFGFAASSAIYEGVVLSGTGSIWLIQEENHQLFQNGCGWQDGDIPSRLFGMLHFQLDLADEARQLMAGFV